MFALRRPLAYQFRVSPGAIRLIVMCLVFLFPPAG